MKKFLYLMVCIFPLAHAETNSCVRAEPSDETWVYKKAAREKLMIESYDYSLRDQRISYKRTTGGWGSRITTTSFKTHADGYYFPTGLGFGVIHIMKEVQAYFEDNRAVPHQVHYLTEESETAIYLCRKKI